MVEDEARRLIVSIQGRDPRRSGEVRRWIRLLLPTAILLLGSPPSPPPDGTDEVITVDADAVQSGPLSIAAALLRDHARR